MNLGYAAAFAFLLMILQLLTHTDLFFSLCCFFFVLTAALAFNVAGGLTRPSGTYVFFFALLTAIVGFIAKIVFGEPAQSRLQVPIPTIETYLAAMVAMLFAVYLSRRFSRRKGLLQDVVSDANMRAATIGCVVAGVGLTVLGPILASGGTETVFTPILRASNQLNRFLEMAIILGVTYEVKRSGGKSSLSAPVLIAWAVLFFQGVILGYSKEALFSPFVCWLAAAAVLGYRFKPITAITATLLFVFFFVYMVPYCQYGRNYRNTTFTFTQNATIAFDILSRLPEVKRQDLADQAEINSESTLVYYNEPHGLIDRLQMLSIDDALHVVTDQNGPLGLTIIWAYVANAVPHVLWKDKPILLTANIYGHELGALAPEDEVTSVSVSPIAEAYRVAKWPGILVLAPVIWFLLFLVMDSVCGDLRKSPWGILVLASFSHQANEGGLASPVYMLTFGLFGILFVAFFTAYLLPLLAVFVTPPKRDAIVANPIRSVSPN